MGRNKIKIEPINEKKKRNVTFQKRKFGLFKKAMELSILCECDIALMIFKKGRVYEYGSKDVHQSLVNYINHTYPSSETYTNVDYMSEFNTARPKVKKEVVKRSRSNTINRKLLLEKLEPINMNIKKDNESSVSSMEEDDEENIGIKKEEFKKETEQDIPEGKPKIKQEEKIIKKEDKNVYDNYSYEDDESTFGQSPNINIPLRLDFDRTDEPLSYPPDPETRDKSSHFYRYQHQPSYSRENYHEEYQSTIDCQGRYGYEHQFRQTSHHVYPNNYYFDNNPGYSYSRHSTNNFYNNYVPQSRTTSLSELRENSLPYHDVYPKSYQEDTSFQYLDTFN